MNKRLDARLRIALALLLLALYSPGGWAEYTRDYLDQHPMQVVDAHGVEIAYRRIGPTAAETAVLVMGLGASHTVWGDAFVRGIIASGFQVLLIDNRDTGGINSVCRDREPCALVAVAEISRRSAGFDNLSVRRYGG